jgi:hypothetical protein
MAQIKHGSMGSLFQSDSKRSTPSRSSTSHLIVHTLERNITRKTRDGHVFASLGTGTVQYLKSQLLSVESNSGIVSSPSLSKDEVNDIVNAAIDNRVLPLIESTTARVMADDLVKVNIAPLTETIEELQTYTQNQFKAVREELKKATSDRKVTTDAIAIPTIPAKTTDKSPSIKSWAEFFKMVGVVALTAGEAQKKENIDTRAKQIEQGFQAARELGLGEWAVKVAGRSFVRMRR